MILVAQDAQEGTGPSIGIPGNTATVTIAENDNARGVIQFHVNRVSTHSEAYK